MLDPADVAEALWDWWPALFVSFLRQLVALALVVVGLALWVTQGMALLGGAALTAGVGVLVVSTVQDLLGRDRR